MFAYWMMFCVYALGALGSNIRDRFRPSPTPILFLAGLMMTLLIGLRWQVGGDWHTYHEIYRSIAQSDVMTAADTTEPAYGLLNWIMAQIGLDIWAINLVCAAIFVIGLTAFARQQPNPWLAIVVAIPFLVIVVAMGYTRQGAAIGLSMLGLAALQNANFRRCLVLLLLASTFHRSALVLIPIVGLSFSKDRLQTIAMTLIASILAYFLLLSSVIDRYSAGYIEQVYQAEGAGIRLAMNILPAAIILLFPKQLGMEGNERRLWSNLAWFGLLLNILYLVIESNVAIDRMGIYAIPMQMVVFSRLPALFGRPGHPDKTITMVVIGYAALVQFVWLTYGSNARSWLPYEFMPLVT